MPTLYVENVPKDLYEALRKRAKSERRSIAGEVIEILERFVPTEKELKRRREWVQKLRKLNATIRPLSTDGPTSTEMIREDREIT
jgi:plasmid stability protein